MDTAVIYHFFRSKQHPHAKTINVPTFLFVRGSHYNEFGTHMICTYIYGMYNIVYLLQCVT